VVSYRTLFEDLLEESVTRAETVKQQSQLQSGGGTEVTPQEIETREGQFTTEANREEPSEPLFSPNDAQGFRYAGRKSRSGSSMSLTTP